MHDPDSDSTFVTREGVTMPRLVYGTAWKKGRTAALVTQALCAGFRGLDTAGQPRHYAEAGVGAGIAAAAATGIARGDLYVQTKFTPPAGQDPATIPYDPAAAPGEQVRQSFARSRENLGLAHVDALLLHSPLPPPAFAEVWAAMEGLVTRGEVRILGLSNCHDVPVLEALWQRARVKPSVLQNRFHARSRFDTEIRAFCRRHDIVYQSFWTLTANPQVLDHARVRALARRYRRTPPQILFRYLTQVGVVPLTGTTSQIHMREDLSIFDFTLTLDEQAGLAPLFR
ncbi:MAG: aldo/keto reductase family protein [Gammaproteobacteria bacterium]